MWVSLLWCWSRSLLVWGHDDWGSVWGPCPYLQPPTRCYSGRENSGRCHGRLQWSVRSSSCWVLIPVGRKERTTHENNQEKKKKKGFFSLRTTSNAVSCPSGLSDGTRWMRIPSTKRCALGFLSLYSLQRYCMRSRSISLPTASFPWRPAVSRNSGSPEEGQRKTVIVCKPQPAVVGI